MKKNSILWRDVKRIIKNNIKWLLWISLLLWFLFYLFNIFFSLCCTFNKVNNIVTDKVGIYFYIDDSLENNDQTYKKIINIKEQLEEKWIEVNFSSKDDAFSFLENKIPEITKNFDKFGIENPLPSTLYVMFDNKKEYTIMKDIIIENKDMILNIKDIDKWATLQQQENRSLKIIEIMKTIENSIYFILIMLVIIIISFTQLLLKTFFFDFYKELQTKKLLWATHKDTNGGFILALLFLVTIGFIIWLALVCITFNILDNNLVALWINFDLCSIVPKLLLSYIWFSLIATILGYNNLNSLEKRM
jgi:cell division protein FtsX